MHRALVLIWGLIFAISTSAYGQENFTVSGEISFQEEKGQLCVWLRNLDEHDFYLKPAAPARSLIIIPNQQQLQAKKVTFKFVAVPKGFYCIFTFQDLNGNGIQDHSPQTGLAIEPYRFSGPPNPYRNWDDMKFEVDKDISGIEIKF